MKKLLAIGAILVSAAATVFATTWDNTVGGTAGYPAFAARPVYTLVKTINFATDTNNYAKDDVIKLFNVPATSIVLSASYVVKTATTNDAWFDLGTIGSSTLIADSIAGTNPIYATETLYATPGIAGVATNVILTCHTNAPGNTGVMTFKINLLNINE